MSEIVCPKCKTVEMKENKHGVYVCPKCKGLFMPESIYGVT